MQLRSILGAGLMGALAVPACSSSGDQDGTGTGGTGGGSSGSTASGVGGRAGRGGTCGSADSGASGDGSSGAGQAGSDAGGSADCSKTGWLHTRGNKIYREDESVWMGRGANIDDAYLCGYNYQLTDPNIALTMKGVADGLVTEWKANFIRIMLAMASYPTTSTLLTDNPEYKLPMVDFINSIGKHPDVYVLVTVRSDLSMIGHDEDDGDPEATGLPSSARTTPDAAQFPTGTDAAYVALVDAFAQSSFVMFGLTNEPGGNQLPNPTIHAAMSHAVDVIRAEEDRLGVPHHIVSVQGQQWTSNISYFGRAPLPQDNVVYEVHGYPPTADTYTYANLPVIIGEYGFLPNPASFYADLEAKQIPNLAFSFSPYSDCDPDLLEVNYSSTEFVPTYWGTIVKDYLTSHAP